MQYNFSPQLKQILPEILSIRRHIHSHPELSGQEKETSILIASELKNYGWTVRQSKTNKGVIADLGCNEVNKIIGLRVDMDALPIQEHTGLKFSSLNNGIMH